MSFYTSLKLRYKRRISVFEKRVHFTISSSERGRPKLFETEAFERPSTNRKNEDNSLEISNGNRNCK